MFFGFPPSAKKSFFINEFIPHQFLIIALEAAKKLKWEIDQVTNTGFQACIKKPDGRNVSVLTFRIVDDRAFIESRSVQSIIDFGKNGRNIRQFNDQIIDLKYDLKPVELEQRWEALKPELISPPSDEISETTINEEPATKNNYRFLSWFIPREGYFITPILIYMNILLFVIQVISGANIFNPSIESLLQWGGNYRPMTLDGQWWRLLTNCFLHIGIFHLLMNMYALLYIGMLLEKHTGKFSFAYTYVLTGIFASLSSLYWHENTVSAGASGAIFGMYGLFLALLMTNRIDKNIRKEQLTSIGIFIVYNLVYGMKAGIDNAAHIGGLVSGIVMGFSLYPFLKNPEFRLRNIFIHSTALLTLTAGSFYLISGISNPIGDYSRIMEQFGANEQKALSVYKLPEFSGDDKYMYAITNEGLPGWKICRNLIDSIDKIGGLPEELKSQNVLLRLYCDYRIESFKLMEVAISQNKLTLQPIINQYNEKIDLILRKLNGEEIADSLLTFKPKIPNFMVPPGVFWVVDGIPVDNVDFLTEKDIQSLSVLKPNEAMSLYGEKAREGAVIINTYAGGSNQVTE